MSAERALATVDLGAIERNCRRLCSALTGGARLCAVVKADGYGHGEVESARAALAGGATMLAVATAGEADVLRQAGVADPVLVMGAVTSAEVADVVGADAELAVWDTALVAELETAARRAGRPLRVHVKLDSGMGRLGAPGPDAAHEVVDAVVASPSLELAALMTHFATADELGDDHFPRQLERFRSFVARVRQAHPGVRAHAANSAAALREPAGHFDLVRCGVAIYGLDPFGDDPDRQGLEPALGLSSYVAMVKRFEAGDSAGYGRTWTAAEPTWVAVVPIGYGDGVRRALSNNLEVLVGGRRRALVGTVSMDNVTVELGRERDGVAVGDEVVLIGAQGDERILAEEWAARLGTINYEVTCGIGPRVRRRHLRR